MDSFNSADGKSKEFFTNVRNRFREIEADYNKSDKEQQKYEKVSKTYDNAINRFINAKTAFDFGD